MVGRMKDDLHDFVAVLIMFLVAFVFMGTLMLIAYAILQWML